MLPLFFIIQMYYLVAKVDATVYEDTLSKVKRKKYPELLLDGLIGTWFGSNDYTYVTWTLTVELWATYYVYILASTVVYYQNRWILYTIVLLFLYIPKITEDLGYTNY
jgi:tRNA isopentenyl-2-thiomethyl-A-37 hydroxylase MiaE